MSVTISNIQRNHRGVAFQFIGDGVTTTATVTHGQYVRANMPTSNVFVTTGSTVFGEVSQRGGFQSAIDGVSVTATAAAVPSGSVTVTTNPAVANGTTAYVVVLFDNDTA